MRRLEGTLVLPDGLARGEIVYDDVGDDGGRIRDVEVVERVMDPFAASSVGLVDGERRPASLVVAEPPFVLPGFIDGHVHGGGGADTMDGAEGVRTMARFHLHRGTTTLLPTTITNPWEKVVAALEAVAEVAREERSVTAPLPSIPGAHLEGPFISPKRLGAQPPFALEPEARRVAELLALDVVRVVTLAPEIPHAADAAETFARAGVRVSFGHTVADAEQVAAVARRVRAVGGTVGFTHLFNAMSQLVGRAPGVVGAALADPWAFAELILDLHHVHPTSFLAALAAKPQRLSLITDAIRACGAGEGESELGGVPVRVEGGTARLADGTLAGSVLTLDQAVRNAVGIGVPLHVASRLASSVPASYLGLSDRGALRAGLRADVVVLDGDLQVREVVVGGLDAGVGAA